MSESSGAPCPAAVPAGPGISLVMPAFNEQAVIAQAVAEAVAALATITADFEVLVVDDGSTDTTAEIVSALADIDSRVRLIRQPENCGYGAALRRGFGEATKGLVGFTDADCQFELRELDRLVLLARDYDIVCGYRIDRKDPWLRRMYSAGYNVLVRTLLGTRVRDCDCALKIFRRDVLVKLPITTDGFLINGEMLASARQQNFSLVEVGVSHRPRAGGESKVSVTHIPVVFAALVRFWWNKVLFAGGSRDADEWHISTRLAMSLVLCTIAGLLALINLGYPFIEPDEARYAQISLEMLGSHDWLVPRLQGQPYLDKPPLLYWLMAASYAMCGENEWAARLPGALAMVLTVLATYWLGRRLIGDRGAWCGAVLLVMCGGFIAGGRYVMMDGLLTLFTTVALLASYYALFAAERRLRWWTLAGVACGLGILTKGPVAPVLCVPPVIGVAWLTKSWPAMRLRNLLAYCVPLLAIATPWFWLVARREAEFVGYFFWKHHIVRYWDSFDHAQPWWFYVPMLALGMMPVTLLLPSLGIYLAQRDQAWCRTRTREVGALLLACAWVFVFFTVSSCKLVTYMLPAFPLLGLTLGKMLDDVYLATRRASDWQQTLARRSVWFATGVVNWGIIGALVFLAILGGHRLAIASIFALFAAMMLTLLYTRRFNSPVKLVAAAAGSYGLLAVLGFGFVVPEFAAWRSVSHSAAQLQASLGGDVPVVFFGRPSQAAAFEIPGDVVEFSTAQTDAFERYLANYPLAVVVTGPQHVPQLRKQCSDTVTLESPRARSRVYVVKRRAVVASRLEAASVIRR